MPTGPQAITNSGVRGKATSEIYQPVDTRFGAGGRWIFLPTGGPVSAENDLNDEGDMLHHRSLYSMCTVPPIGASSLSDALLVCGLSKQNLLSGVHRFSLARDGCIWTDKFEASAGSVLRL